MKIIILIVLLISSLLIAEDCIFENTANLNSEVRLISKNLSVKSHSIEIRWTYSLGECYKGWHLGASKK